AKKTEGQECAGASLTPERARRCLDHHRCSYEHVWVTSVNSAYFDPHFRFDPRTDQAIVASHQQEMRLSGAPRWRGGHHPMGDAKSAPVRLWFNPQLRVEFHGATVTPDAGLLLPRELDERLGLSTLIERHLADPRSGRNSKFPLADLFRQSIYSRLAGYADTNDAERLAEDPTFRMLASRERRGTSVALTSTLHWFETEVLAEERNYQGLARLNTDLVRHEATQPPGHRKG